MKAAPLHPPFFRSGVGVRWDIARIRLMRRMRAHGLTYEKCGRLFGYHREHVRHMMKKVERIDRANRAYAAYYRDYVVSQWHAVDDIPIAVWQRLAMVCRAPWGMGVPQNHPTPTDKLRLSQHGLMTEDGRELTTRGQLAYDLLGFVLSQEEWSARTRTAVVAAKDGRPCA